MRIFGNVGGHDVDESRLTELEHDVQREFDVTADRQPPKDQNAFVFEVADKFAAVKNRGHDVDLGEAFRGCVAHGVPRDSVLAVAHERLEILEHSASWFALFGGRRAWELTVATRHAVSFPTHNLRPGYHGTYPPSATLRACMEHPS